jgi:DNA ligase 1
VLLAQLVAVSQRVSAAAKRLSKIQELAAYLKELPTEDLSIGVNYLSGNTPQGRIGIGHALLQPASELPPAHSSALSLKDVDHAISEIAEVRGGGAGKRRAELIKDLFRKATAAEQRFLLQLLMGELHQGALEGIMIEAIAFAADCRPGAVRRAAMHSPDLGAVAVSALREPPAALDGYQLSLFSPVAPMLAQTAANVTEALSILGGEIALEWKMDGARIQMHKQAEEVRIYTRNLNEISSAIPEIVELARSFTQRSLVLDGETIAFDAQGRPHAFQVTMRRFGRKLNVAKARTEVPVAAFFFDCLFYEGHSLLDCTTQQRIEKLRKAVPAQNLIPRLVTSSADEAHAFYDAAIAAGHEGVMAKSLNAPYEAGNRGAAWLKIKRVHTLDLVVIAAEWGHGRRTGRLSNLHLGALDSVTGQYVMLGKTFKGMTDAILEWQTQQFLARETHRDQNTVYLRPELVVEIAFSDLQTSNRYPGGLALRLARLKRYRTDKGSKDADTMEAVRGLYATQTGGPVKSSKS